MTGQTPQAPSSFLATPLDRATALLDLMERLTGMLEQEIALVRGQHRHHLSDGVDMKQKVARAFEEVGRMLRVDGGGLAALDPEIRQQVADAARALQELCQQNAVLLRIHQDVQNEIVDTMVNTINRERLTENGYSVKKGSIAPARKPKHCNPSTTLDTKL